MEGACRPGGLLHQESLRPTRILPVRARPERKEDSGPTRRGSLPPHPHLLSGLSRLEGPPSFSGSRPPMHRRLLRSAGYSPDCRGPAGDPAEGLKPVPGFLARAEPVQKHREGLPRKSGPPRPGGRFRGRSVQSSGGQPAVRGFSVRGRNPRSCGWTGGESPGQRGLS